MFDEWRLHIKVSPDLFTITHAHHIADRQAYFIDNVGFASTSDEKVFHSFKALFQPSIDESIFFCALVCQICGFFRVQFIHRFCLVN